MALHIINEANRCLNCKKPMCQQGCPVHTPIPEIIRLFQEHKITEAGKRLFDNNPLSVICAVVCDHETQCAGHCVLGKKGNPIHFSSIESYISDMYLERMEIPEVPKKGKSVAVIGAGPAGITAAVELARGGYDVTVFEEKDEIGAAMDVARTALRNGARHVRLYARGKRISASSNEMSYAELDGAEFIFGKAITAIDQNGPVFQTCILDEDGRITGYEEELDYVKADSTIIAISQGPKNKLILTTEGLKGSENGLLIVDENGMTTCEGVFAAGDVVHGAKTVVHAVAEAKKTAAAMMHYIESKKE